MAVLMARFGDAGAATKPEKEALVPIFAGGPDYQSGTRFAVAEMRVLCDEFLDLIAYVQQFDPAGWNRYAAEVWPEFSDELPTQEEVVQGLAAGRVYFGPFIAYTEAQPGTAADGSAVR